MTPKEKAIELMQKFRSLDLSELSKNNDGIIVGIKSKQCALIAVDEIMKLFYKDGGIDCFEYIYWTEVKNEIERL